MYNRIAQFFKDGDMTSKGRTSSNNFYKEHVHAMLTRILEDGGFLDADIYARTGISLSTLSLYRRGYVPLKVTRVWRDYCFFLGLDPKEALLGKDRYLREGDKTYVKSKAKAPEENRNSIHEMVDELLLSRDLSETTKNTIVALWKSHRSRSSRKTT